MEKIREFNEKGKVLETIIENGNVDYNNLYVLGDNISTKDILTTGSCLMLSDYVPIYSATIYERLQQTNYKLLGKSIISELGMGDVNGSAELVAKGFVKFGIGSDVDGSIIRSAISNNIIGFKPSYGLISRYGVFSIASSLEQVGFHVNNIYDLSLLINLLKGKDGYDMTVIDNECDYTINLNNDLRGKKLGYFACFADEFLDTIKFLEDKGVLVDKVKIDFDLLKLVEVVTKVIIYSEATSNTANLNGVLFGQRETNEDVYELIKGSRSKYLSSEVKRKLLMGEYFLQEGVFFKANKIRGLIIAEIAKIFNSYDGLIVNDKMIKLANLGGYPSITIPYHNFNLSIISNLFKDDLLLNIAYQLKGEFKCIK